MAAISTCSLAGAAAAAETIALDRNDLSIRFRVEGLWLWRIEGRFSEARGKLSLDAREPARSWLTVVVHTGSIDTGYARRDSSLRSADFFDAARHPLMIFESTSIDLVDQHAGIISGNLNFLGVTRPLRLTFEVNAPRQVGSLPNAIPLVNIRASGILRRSEWGMTALIPAISDEVFLEIRADVANFQGPVEYWSAPTECQRCKP